MLGNYKLRSDRGKLQAQNSVPIHALHRQEMSISGSCLDLHLPPLTSHCFPAHSLVLSVSIRLPSSFSPLHCSGMCISAVSDESVVYRALLCVCVCIFMYHVRTCRQETRTVSRKTGNYPPRSWKMGLFQLLSRLYPTKYPHLVPNSA